MDRYLELAEIGVKVEARVANTESEEVVAETELSATLGEVRETAFDE